MENNKEVTCPVCGSSAVDMSTTKKTITERYGTPVEVSMEVYKCRVCGMEGDFSGHGDEIIEKAIENSKHKAIVHIIEEFIRNEISMSSIERALDLPQRTLTKWKNGLSTPSATGAALMNVIRTYPWILTVAQYKYDPFIARNVHISNAITELLKITPLGYGSILAETGVFMTPGSLVMYQKYDRTDEEDSTFVININVAAENSIQASYSIQNQNVSIAGV